MEPTSIEADRAAGTLTIRWEDGHTSVYGLAALRWACPCAICHGEMGQPGLLDQINTLPDDELQLADAWLVGRYGMGLRWESGHSTGIYTFDYLRALDQEE